MATRGANDTKKCHKLHSQNKTANIVTGNSVGKAKLLTARDLGKHATRIKFTEFKTHLRPSGWPGFLCIRCSGRRIDLSSPCTERTHTRPAHFNRKLLVTFQQLTIFFNLIITILDESLNNNNNNILII